MELTCTYGSFLESGILKLAHHGSISSTSAEFLQGVRPEMSVISVGKRNRFNHPSPVVLDRLKDAGCSYLRTDEEGAIIFESDGKKWKRFHWR
jgi:competence protein ComEC